MIRPQVTRHQVPRGARPDAETQARLLLVKNVSVMHATYQVRWLAFRAGQVGKKLVLKVPKDCKVSRGLREFVKEHPKLIVIEKGF